MIRQYSSPPIGIFGLGYVGLTTAACLIQRGYQVVGYDVSSEKISLLASGQIPITEPGVGEILTDGMASGSFSFRTIPAPGEQPPLSFVCVGTPVLPDGTCNLRAIHSVLGQIEHNLNGQPAPTMRAEVIIRSTLPPGTLRTLGARYPDLLEKATVCVFPEFLREGTAIIDFFHPPQTLVGTLPGQPSPTQLAEILQKLDFPTDYVESGVAEMLKAACNAFHSVKVSFANEIGRLARELKIDGQEVMQLLIRDTKLNVSPAYLLPGPPYGGSCLPKDTRMLAALGAQNRLGTSLFAACETTNKAHMEYLASRILERGPSRVAILGLAFKGGTDDLRESPSLTLIELLMLQPGLQVRTHDFAARPEQLLGLNRRIFDTHGQNPHLRFSNHLDETLRDADLIVIMQRQPAYAELAQFSPIPVLDFANWTWPPS